MKILRSTAVAMLVGLGALFAQENSVAQTSGVPEVSVGAVEQPENEKETPLQAMIRGFELIRQEHEGNASRFERIQKQVQELQRMPTANAYTVAAVALLQDMGNLRDRLLLERENQIAFKNRIDSYSSERTLFRQETSYLGHYLEELRLFGVEQEKTVKFMAAVDSSIRSGLQKLPLSMLANMP